MMAILCTHQRRLSTLLVLQSCVLMVLTSAFVVKQSPLLSQPRAASQSFALHGAAPPFLLGRFRKKRKVEQTKTVEVGDTIPDVDVEQLARSEGSGEAVSIRQVLGNSTAVLVGMPGAFTPTCSKEHLPGYVAAAPKLTKLGIDKIAVVTTNDRFVNEQWSEQQLGAIKKDDNQIITMLCDGDGDLVKNLGLAEDMGFGVGVRSKRFALVANDGVVSQLLTDEGMDDCSATSAENLIRVLSPEGSVADNEEMSGAAIGAAGVAGLVLLYLLSSFSGGGTSGTTAPRSSPQPKEPQVRMLPTKPRGESGFSLLKEYN